LEANTSTYGGLAVNTAKGGYRGLNLGGIRKLTLMSDDTGTYNNSGIYNQGDSKWMLLAPTANNTTITSDYNISAIGFIGPLTGNATTAETANKIRTTAPASPANGDIWLS